MRGVAAKLFGFMSNFVFAQDSSTRALVLQYPELEKLMEITLL